MCLLCKVITTSKNAWGGAIKKQARGPWIVSVLLQETTLQFLAYNPCSSSQLTTRVSALDYLPVSKTIIQMLRCDSALLPPETTWEPSRWWLPAILARAVQNASTSTLSSLASVAASLAVNDAARHVTCCITWTESEVPIAAKKMQNRLSVAFGLQRRGIIAAIAPVAGTRSFCQVKNAEGMELTRANFVTLHFSADSDTPLLPRLLHLSKRKDDVIRKLIQAPIGTPLRKVVLKEARGDSVLWPEKVVICFADIASCSKFSLKCTRVNVRATAILREHSAGGLVQTVYGTALWMSPIQNVATHPNETNKTSGLMIAYTLASQDADATAARKANCRAQNHIKATRLDQVNIAKNQWRDVAERRLLALLPWMERASRVTKGSGGLVRCHHPHTITCLSTLQVHAEASLQRAHGDVFDAVTSMIRN